MAERASRDTMLRGQSGEGFRRLWGGGGGGGVQVGSCIVTPSV